MITLGTPTILLHQRNTHNEPRIHNRRCDNAYRCEHQRRRIVYHQVMYQDQVHVYNDDIDTTPRWDRCRIRHTDPSTHTWCQHMDERARTTKTRTELNMNERNWYEPSINHHGAFVVYDMFIDAWDSRWIARSSIAWWTHVVCDDHAPQSHQRYRSDALHRDISSPLVYAMVHLFSYIIAQFIIQ